MKNIPFTTTFLKLIQLSVAVLAVNSLLEAENLPNNNLVLSPEPLICGTIDKGVSGATQIN